MSERVYRPTGALTVATVGAALDEVLPAIRAGTLDTLDFSRVAHADSAALALILAARRAALEAATPLTVCPLSDDLAALAELYGVGALIAA